MTAISPPADLMISGELTSRLREVARRRWYVLAAVGIFKTLITGLIALLAAVLLLGYFQNLWLPARMSLAFAVWIFLLAAAIRFLRPAFGRWSLSKAAFQIEHNSPDLQERLSSAIELADETDPRYRGSPDLIAHLFGQAEADAESVQPKQVVSTTTVWHWAILFAPILIAWSVTMLTPATTHTAMVGLYCVFMPWKAVLPASFTEVVVKPGDVTVVQGDAMEITAHLAFDTGNDSASKHATLVRHFANGPHLTDQMESAGSHDYRFHLDDVEQTFSYMISTSTRDSQWFTTTVHPRPQMTSLEIRCDYPAYTGMASAVTGDGDGTIQALVGTRVTVSIHTAMPIDIGKSQILVDKDLLPITQPDASSPAYQTQFVVKNTGEYRISLANEFDLKNKDDQPRSIIAQPDEVPTISIRSPEPEVRVGVDDVVPVKYTARDDFAVAKIDALIQIDDQPVQTVPVKSTSADKKNVTGPAYVISVADLLKSQVGKPPQSISYQLRVTDNRDPDPQVGFSSKQVLRIDRNSSEKFEAREDRKSAAELKEAIQRAINQLDQEQAHVQAARDMDPNQPLDEWRKRQIHEAAREIPKTSDELAKAADDAKDTSLANVAEQVKQIATKDIPAAAEDAAKADLNADHGKDRHQAAEQAMTEIAQAHDALQKIENDQAVDKAEHQAEAVRDLTDAAKEQQAAADKMQSQEQMQPPDRQTQQEQQQAMRDQQRANQKLQEAMQQSEALRDPQAQQTAQKLQDLIRKVEDLQKHEDATAEQTQKQQATADIEQKANALAQKQEALNKQIQKAADENKDALQKANANPPNKDQQQNIVKALNRDDIQQAHDQMQQAANQLDQAANQLQQQAKSNDLHPTQKQQEAINEDQHAEDAARHKQDAAEQAANDLKQPNPPQDAMAHAQAAAKDIEKQATELPPHDDDAKQDAEAAEHAADEAAHAENPQEAQNDLNEAAKDLDHAGHELADAAKANTAGHEAEMIKAQQHDAAEAAKIAADLAKQQQELAQAAAEQQKALTKIANPPPAEQTAQQQNEVAGQADEAQHQADQLQHQAEQAHDPDVRDRAEQANADLAKAHQEAAEAAKEQEHAAHAEQEAHNADNAEHAHQADQNAEHALAHAADEQREAQADLAKAQNELRDLPTEETASAQAHADANAQPEAGQHHGTAKGQATAQQQAAQAAQEAAQAQQDASQQNPQAAQQAANALARAAQEMARATPGMHQGEPDNKPGNEPGQEPSPTAGQSPDSKQGITAALANLVVPESVLDIGITADQWAILPPLEKKDLLNAAQQSGPPGYRQMTKDYFAKIAKMQTSSDGQ